MPGSISQQEHVADSRMPNRTPRIHDGSGNSIGVDGDTRSGGMASSDKSASAAQLRDNGGTLDSSNTSGAITGSADSNQAKELYTQTGSGESDSAYPAQGSSGDWDPAPDTEDVNDPSSSYYYEPQGELIQERNRLPPQAEITIPHHKTGSGTQELLAGEAINSDSLAIPRRPARDTGISSHNMKRKSSLGLAEVATKRPQTMSEWHPGNKVDFQPSSLSSMGTHCSSPRAVDDSASTAEEQLRGFPNPDVQMVLPARKAFPIQIGDKLFRLSGASISSDAPSYFSQFFEEQMRNEGGAENCRTLYIDRDPATFEDISLHLQGYHTEPRDGPHFVKLFADAQFFSLPRLTAQLFSSTIYIRIGEQEFRIPKELFNSPGDSPNYFSLGFSSCFTTPNDRFPGLSQRTLLRPPSLLPPSVPTRSAQVFADLVRMLQGYEIGIRGGEHRNQLLRDARYYHLKGLEQRLIPHQISYNPGRQISEILIRLEDIKTTGLMFMPESSVAGAITPATSPDSSTASIIAISPGWIYYQRPYVDSRAHCVVVEIGGEESTILELEPAATTMANTRVGRVSFHKQVLTRFASLLTAIAEKSTLPVVQPLESLIMEGSRGPVSSSSSPQNTGNNAEKFKVQIGIDADVVVDGKVWSPGGHMDRCEMMDVDDETGRSSSRGRLRRPQSETNGLRAADEWVVRKAQWRLRVQAGSDSTESGRGGMEVMLSAVKIQAYSTERSRNASRGFLT